MSELSNLNKHEILSRVSEIKRKYELIAEITGERFNIFDILNLRTNETRTHSAFLRELLDPKGRHGMKDTFLKAFLRMLSKAYEHSSHAKRSHWTEISTKSARIRSEISIGLISEDYSEGGRIDLVIEPDGAGKRIMIENKIYAGDQNCQLIRYRNHDKSAFLIYLTLDGTEASSSSIENLATNTKLKTDEDYFRLSYKVDILSWLEDCRKEASNYPLVRETISQYANLIKSLTQQNPNQKMSTEITNIILRDKDTFTACESLHNEFIMIQRLLYDHICVKLTALAEKHKMQFHSELIPGGKSQGFYFTPIILEKENIQIGFASEDFGKKWFFGFSKKSNPSDETNLPKSFIENLRNEFVKFYGSVDDITPWWPVSDYWREYLDWTTETLASIHFDNCEISTETKFISDVSKKLERLNTIAVNVFNHQSLSS